VLLGAGTRLGERWPADLMSGGPHVGGDHRGLAPPPYDRCGDRCRAVARCSPAPGSLALRSDGRGCWCRAAGQSKRHEHREKTAVGTRADKLIGRCSIRRPMSAVKLRGYNSAVFFMSRRETEAIDPDSSTRYCALPRWFISWVEKGLMCWRRLAARLTDASAGDSVRHAAAGDSTVLRTRATS